MAGAPCSPQSRKEIEIAGQAGNDEKLNVIPDLIGDLNKKNMKGIFIAYDQAYNMDIADALQALGVRGFTMWQDIAGRGSQTGEPHLGSHAWPTMNNAMLTFVDDDKVDDILAKIRAMDEETPDLGLRAFVWNVEKHY